jgi:uncharacterized phage protein (TIGR02218 family)
MKAISTALLDYLLSTDVESTTIADLFTVTLTSGLVIRCNDFQIPLTSGGNVFLPTRWGSWRCNGTKCALGSLASSADFEVFAGTDELMPDWLCTVNEAASLGLFDAAEILIETAYTVESGQVASGFTEIRFGGQITSFTPVGRTTIKGEAKPYTFTLNQNMPRKVLQPSCGWVLGDAGCTINLALFRISNTVAAGTNNIAITAATTITQPDGYYSQGVLKFTSGRNNNLSGAILDHTGQVLTLSRPFPFPVSLTDAFTITAGCDHTQKTCLQKFANIINYGGAPYIPDRERAL